MSSTTTSVLFDPLEFAGLRLKNRLVMAPMGSCQSDADGVVSDQTVAYYRRRAEGGVGTITVEAALVTPDAHGHEPRLHGPEHVPGMRRIVEAARPHGTTVGIQLMHPGRQVVSGPAVGPSAVAINSAAPIPHALSSDEVERAIGQYATAARLAEQAGFDFVEVHGAHGYLPSDFLSPVANQRDDAWGGSLERRARFVLEVVRAIRAATEFPLFWRLSGEELIPGGYTVDDQVQVARWLEQAGVACLSMSAGTWLALQITVAPMFVPRGRMIQYAARVKQAVDIPVIAVGRLDDPQLAERVVSDGSADLVMIGRGLIADADWPRKLELGEVAVIRPCIACNACVDRVAVGQEMRCAVNPETGRESDWRILAASPPRHVLVVGSGPAGLEAARIARLRGHRVSLWERDPVLGGKLDVASRAPSKAEVRRFREFQTRTLHDIGVEVHTGAAVTAEVVSDEDPDVVVLATGAGPLYPAIPGIDGAHVLDAQEILTGRVELAPDERVTIVGGSATGCETAELLLGRVKHVAIFEMLGSIGQGIEQITRRHLVRTLRRGGVEIRTRCRVIAIEAEQVVFETVGGAVEERFTDRVALAVGWRPRGPELASALDGRRVVTIGDAAHPADFVAAVGAGAEVALSI